jgi:NAD(P)-dependent dehydrogenase (short-subunit alcohol dehydrogenase family)
VNRLSRGIIMKIIIIGATGTIGKGIVAMLSPQHDIIPVGHSSGKFHIDLSSRKSIRDLFRQVKAFDAVVSAAGAAKFGSLDELEDDDYMLGLSNKLMGQVNLVRIGREFINDNGSFTLTSGILAQHPMPGSTSVSMVNAGLEGFVRAAALEMQRGIRVNGVSPIWIRETMESMGMEASGGMPASNAAKAYKESVEGSRTGEILDVRDFA